MLFLLPSVKAMKTKELMVEFLVLEGLTPVRKMRLRSRRVAVAREIERRMGS